MDHDRSRLDTLQIASPCSADWNTMQGDQQRRFCGECKLHVHDLSALTAAEADALLQQDGGVCVRFYRRADGRVLTQDCPVGLRQRLRRSWGRAVALATALLAFVGCRGEAGDAASKPGDLPPVQEETPQRPDGGPVMGLAAPPPEKSPAPTPSPARPGTGSTDGNR